MPLSKLVTLAQLRSDIREIAKEIGEDKVGNPAVDRIIKYNILDLHEMLNGATQPDYGETAILSDAAANYSTTIVSAPSGYLESTKTITKTSHGLTNADIGKRIVLVDTDTNLRYGVSQIAGITSVNAFTILHSMGGNIPVLGYAVLTPHSSSYLDLSSLKYDKLIKLVDSINGLVPLKKAFEFENAINLVHNVTECFAYHEGEKIYLVKGSSVSSWGTLTLHYYRLPQMPSADTDYIDVKDKHMKLLLDKCVLDVFSLAHIDAPAQMQTNVDAKTQAIRQLNTEKEASLKTKQRN